MSICNTSKTIPYCGWNERGHVGAKFHLIQTIRKKENVSQFILQECIFVLIKANYVGPVNQACWSDMLCQAWIWQLSCWSCCSWRKKTEEEEKELHCGRLGWLFMLLTYLVTQRGGGWRFNHQGFPSSFMTVYCLFWSSLLSDDSTSLVFVCCDCVSRCKLTIPRTTKDQKLFCFF